MVESRFYKEMVKIREEKHLSIRQLAFYCGINYLTFIQFFNPNLPFKPVSQKTKYRIHNQLGISYEVMDEYNELIYKERGV